MLSNIKQLIRKHDVLYALGLCVLNRKNPNLYRLIIGYFSENLSVNADYASIIIRNIQEGSEIEPIYLIDFGREKVKSTGTMGFCALIRIALMNLPYAKKLGYTPVIFWGKQCCYYDEGMNDYYNNAFYYYFLPVSQVADIKPNMPYVHVDKVPGRINILKNHGYLLEEEDIVKMAEIYKEYIHLNASTQEYIDANISRCINGGRILGVHVRGTDFNHGYSGHPRVVTPKEYLEKTKEIFSKGKYDRIFLATEDSGALELFRNEFDKELVYYDDVFRSANDIGPHIMPDNRPLHHYKLGLEVLRDVYTLANCDALVCGLSQVSFTARYVNLALGRKFEQVEVINKGINKKDSACAKKHRRIWIKEHN